MSGLLKDPEKLRADLDAMIRFERDTVFNEPEHEAKAWLNKVTELENKRIRFQDMAAEGLITLGELREKLLALEETRETARRKLAALHRRQERIQELERDRDALLDSLVAVSPDALEALAPEERLNVYQMLGLRVVLRSDGGIEASGTLTDDHSVCMPTAARA